MKGSPRCRTQAGNISRIAWDFRFNKNNMQMAAFFLIRTHDGNHALHLFMDIHDFSA